MIISGEDAIRNIPEQVAENTERLNQLDPEALKEEVVSEAIPEVVEAVNRGYLHKLALEHGGNETDYLWIVNNDPNPFELSGTLEDLEDYLLKGIVKLSAGYIFQDEDPHACLFAGITTYGFQIVSIYEGNLQVDTFANDATITVTDEVTVLH